MENRVEQIERAAAELFFRKGFHATSIRDIAHAVGFQAPSIYHHFENKQQLLVSILSKTMDSLIRGAQLELMQYSDPRDQLRQVIRRHVLYHGLRPTESTIGDTELRGLDLENRPVIIGKRDLYQRIFEQIIEFGERTGVFSVPDRKLAAYALIEMCNQVGLWYRPGGRLTLEEITDVYSELALRMVGASGVPAGALAEGDGLRLSVAAEIEPDRTS